MTNLNEIKQIEKTIKADTQQQLKELLAFMILNDEAKAIREIGKMIYYVTTHGEVYSYNKNNKTIRKLKPYVDTYDYLYVRIGGKNLAVHRLVCEAFDPEFEPHLQINHIRKNEKQNNHIDNLEVCTLIENIAHKHMSDKLPHWDLAIKDMRVAETIATDEKNLQQVLDFHYMMSHFISNAINITEVHDISEKEVHQSC